MNQNESPNDAYSAVTEATVLQVLEQAPHVTIPEGFAKRLAHTACEQPVSTSDLSRQAVARFHGGVTPVVASVAAVLLFVALFAFAPHLKPSFLDLHFDLELLLLGELSGVIYLLAGFSLR